MRITPKYSVLCLRRFMCCKEGSIAALELSILLPIFLVMVIGGIEYTRYINATQKMNTAVSVAADFVAQQDEACQTRMQTALTEIRNPLLKFTNGNSSSIGIRAMSVVGLTNTYSPRVNYSGFAATWSITSGPVYGCTNFGGNLVCTMTVNGLPGGLLPDSDDNFIAVELIANYEPLLDISGNFVSFFSNTFFPIYSYSISSPRNGDMTSLNNGC